MLFWKFFKAIGFFILALVIAYFLKLYNLELFFLLNQLGRDSFSKLFAIITMMGDGSFVLLILFFIFGNSARLISVNGPMATIGLLSFLFGGAFVQIIKHAGGVMRPAHVLGESNIHIIGPVLKKYSFPSGHSASALGLAALLVLLSSSKKNKAIFLILGIIAALSRVVVGAHGPLDSFVGGVIGYSFTHIFYRLRPSLEAFYLNICNSASGKGSIFLIVVYLFTIIVAVYLGFLDPMAPAVIKIEIRIFSFIFIGWAIWNLIHLKYNFHKGTRKTGI